MAEHALRNELTDEAELIARARRKDTAAIAQIVTRQNQRLYRIARSILQDDGEAEDAPQEAYIRAFTSLDSFRGEAGLGTWLARIVINEALGRLRRRKPSIDFDAFAKAAEGSGNVVRFRFANPELDPERAWPNVRFGRCLSAPLMRYRTLSAPSWSLALWKA